MTLTCPMTLQIEALLRREVLVATDRAEQNVVTEMALMQEVSAMPWCPEGTCCNAMVM